MSLRFGDDSKSFSTRPSSRAFGSPNERRGQHRLWKAKVYIAADRLTAFLDIKEEAGCILGGKP